MAKTMAAFYEIPPYLEKINQFQKQMDLLTRPLLGLQTDYAALSTAVAAALDSPAIRDINRVSKLFDSQSMSALYRIQAIMAKIDTSGITAALRQYQAAVDAIAPKGLQMQLGEQLQEWSRIISKATWQVEPLTEAKVAELTRLSSLAEKYTGGDIVEESGTLSEEEQKIVVSEVEEILLSGENWEQRFAEQIKNFSQTHPVIAWVLEKILFAILISVTANILSSAIGQALFPTKIYKDPCSSSQVIYHLEQHQNVIIVGEVPYYYEVEVSDESSERCYTGYVSKRSISLVENEEESNGLEEK